LLSDVVVQCILQRLSMQNCSYSSCYGFFKKYAKVEIKIHSTY
jgi:hypothetical protein